MMGVRRWFVAFMVALVAVPALHAQKTLRDSALALMDAHKTVDALPLLEALVRRDSTDRLVTEHLAFVLFEGSAALPDAPARKAQRLRARSLFAKAVALGSTSQQVVAVLNAIPPDGGEDFTFSGNAEVNAAMSQAEASFASGEYRKALGLYQRALALDATLYDAAMFSGDAYLHLELIDSAYVWYERATRINPDRETAWRYWSDVLLKHGQPDAARDKAIEAAVADPYTRLSGRADRLGAQHEDPARLSPDHPPRARHGHRALPGLDCLRQCAPCLAGKRWPTLRTIRGRLSARQRLPPQRGRGRSRAAGRLSCRQWRFRDHQPQAPRRCGAARGLHLHGAPRCRDRCRLSRVSSLAP
jgi:tetratricopeptide (TPR) repeat protein